MDAPGFKAAVEARILDWFRQQAADAPSAEAKKLIERLSRLVARGGKRFRPQLMYLTYRAYSSRANPRLVDLGVALEFHHQFLLVHDDLIDNDTVRYDGPNIVGYYLKEQTADIAEAMGILAGDLLFSFACQLVIESKFKPDQQLGLLRSLNQTNVGVIYGQQLDAYNVVPDSPQLNEERLVLIHRLKSALYSTKLPMVWAATLLDLRPAERAKIERFAEAFGVLYQLVDDYSDYFGNRTIFNDRTKYRDYRQGKITYPLYTALRLAAPRERAYLKDHLGQKQLPLQQIKKVVAIIADCGAQAAAQQQLDHYYKSAEERLDELTISPKAEGEFTNLLVGLKL